MPLGILEPKEPQEVPGTCLLSDDPNQKALELYKGADVSVLKHGTGKCSSVYRGLDFDTKNCSLGLVDSDIILVPQPSNDM